MSASHQAPFIAASEPASPERRAFALRDELVDRGLVETGDAEALVHNAAQELSPINGARVVARAWVDPHFRQRLLVNATAAAKELGIEGPEGHQMVAVENTATTHNVIVCTMFLHRVAAAGPATGLVQGTAIPRARRQRSSRSAGPDGAPAARCNKYPRLGRQWREALCRVADAASGDRASHGRATRLSCCSGRANRGCSH
jgi:Nitrile hydratase, alpha chain